ncbi:MAG: hypothetical protein KAW39_03075 [Thermoplasmata archaeon]|nr:hypothetical protein [Thermoplasmata archaeon]
MALIESRPWTQGLYRKQNWGNNLHSLAPYVGRIKPAFAHWLIRTCTSRGDKVLDPFCGIGTVPLEADLMSRRAVGVDLNPYAVAISRAKFDRRPIEEALNWLRRADVNSTLEIPEDVPSWVQEYYDPKTLAEILLLRDLMIEDDQHFLLGCLLGIAHGHRPQYLSVRTGYIIPYMPSPKPEAQYRSVVDALIRKAKRTYRTPFALKTSGKIIQADSRKLPLEDDSVDAVISSPPYFDTLDYVSSNKLRLALMGIYGEDQEKLRTDLMQNRSTYIRQMETVGTELLRVLRRGSFCVLVLGDVHGSGRSLRTADEIFGLYSDLGFRLVGCVADEIPPEKTTIVKFNGEDGIRSRQSRRKYDRILVLRTPD